MTPEQLLEWAERVQRAATAGRFTPPRKGGRIPPRDVYRDTPQGRKKWLDKLRGDVDAALARYPE